MATVEVYTKAKSDEIFDSTVIGGEIDGSNHLILTTRDATEIDAGEVLSVPPDASATVKGIVELATDAETITGTDAVRAVTPAGFAAAFAAGFAAAIALAGIGDLDDTDLTGLANGEFLRYDGTNWYPEAVVIVCTSGTRPATPRQGDFIFETDTNRFLVCTNATGPVFRRLFIVGQDAWENQLLLGNFATTDAVLSIRLIPADANQTFKVRGDGRIDWGAGGATAQDTNLYRSAANELKTDDSLVIAQNLAHQGSNAGFYNTSPIAKPTVTGSRGGNAALASLCTALANLGLITNSTS